MNPPFDNCSIVSRSPIGPRTRFSVPAISPAALFPRMSPYPGTNIDEPQPASEPSLRPVATPPSAAPARDTEPRSAAGETVPTWNDATWLCGLLQAADSFYPT